MPMQERMVEFSNLALMFEKYPFPDADVSGYK